MAPRAGFVGLGLMGGPMAARLLGAGWEVHGWNRSPAALEPFAAAGGTPVGATEELAGVDTIVFMLPDLPMIEDACAPILERWRLSPPAVRTRLVVMSSVSPVAVKEFGARVADASGGLASVVDAPVSGGRQAAVDGTLAIMAGGDADDVEALTPLFAPLSRSVLRLGGLGAGSLAKACNQLIVGTTAAALAEAAVVAESAGIEAGELFAALSGGLAGSRVLDQLGPRMAARDYTVTGPAQFMAKDLRFVIAAAADGGVQAPLADSALRLYSDLVEAGLGGEDLAVVHHLLRLRSGLAAAAPRPDEGNSRD